MVHAPLQYTGELFILWFETFFGKWENITSSSTYNKIKPRKFEVCNRQCFKSRFRMNQSGFLDPDPDPSRSKWFLKIGQKQRNILFEELSRGVSLSQECEHLSFWGVKKYLYVSFLLNFFPIFVIKTMFYGLDLDPDLLWSKKRVGSVRYLDSAKCLDQDWDSVNLYWNHKQWETIEMKLRH